MKKTIILVKVFLLLLTSACSSVPEEAVKLSYTVGQDLNTLYTSYDKLIQDQFDVLRKARLDYIENRWKPVFIKNWIEKGRLIDVANGKVVWSFTSKSFVPPNSDPSEAQVELFRTVDEWASQAVKQIEEKKRELIEPLDNQEKELRATVREAFNRVIQANSYVTAHLNSIKKVQAVEDKFLEGLDLKDLRDKLVTELGAVSEEAEQTLQEVKEADEQLQKID